jgi:hypothetical protein
MSAETPSPGRLVVMLSTLNTLPLLIFLFATIYFLVLFLFRFSWSEKTFQYGPIILPQFNSSCFRVGFHLLTESWIMNQ